jgi:hypothetical protein
LKGREERLQRFLALSNFVGGAERKRERASSNLPLPQAMCKFFCPPAEEMREK